MEHIERIEAHLAHAKERHPHFADALLSESYIQNAEIDLFILRQLLKCETLFASSILACEIAEVYEAIANGRAEDAIEEIYDACAVLLRMAEWIAEKGCK